MLDLPRIVKSIGTLAVIGGLAFGTVGCIKKDAAEFQEQPVETL
ncbi:MAG: hypothetical protein ORO03_02695 [Alphaproteobacteria bacterium]|nr:hypothetical protein [Alphaproteobacteria bacterium]